MQVLLLIPLYLLLKPNHQENWPWDSYLEKKKQAKLEIERLENERLEKERLEDERIKAELLVKQIAAGKAKWARDHEFLNQIDALKKEIGDLTKFLFQLSVGRQEIMKKELKICWKHMSKTMKHQKNIENKENQSGLNLSWNVLTTTKRVDI